MRTSIREEARSYDAKGSRRDRTIGDRQADRPSSGYGG